MFLEPEREGAVVPMSNDPTMSAGRDEPSFEPEGEIDCPECERGVPLRADVCPHCSIALH